MGLLDIITGGQRSPTQSGQGGLSPIAIALISLLAGKVLGGQGGRGINPGAGGPWGGRGGMGGGLGDILGGGQPRGMPPGSTSGPGGGGLGDLLGGILGGAGGGSVLSGGLNDLMRQMERNGHGEQARSWVGRGSNQPISPEELDQALGPGNVDSLAQEAGIDRVGLLQGLSEQLPEVVDQLTPEGRLPTEDEAEEML
jgi:uncharacterized protein YidB (DUF937 family)